MSQTRRAASRRERTGATAESMAAAQREIAVSEFFAKNRHLLGFDSPRRALLSVVKEAVDNSLDACEEAGILPEVWVEVRAVGAQRYRVAVQDNGPGIVRRQIPLIFGKLLYGSKFHHLRMSRGQQGIGISAAGMYGKLTTGAPVKIISKVSARKPAHYYEIEIDTRRNRPRIHNGRGQGVDIPPGEKGREYMLRHGIRWVSHDPSGAELESGTRVTIELEGRAHRGRGSVAEYLEQTAIANPHVTIHYRGPDEEEQRTWRRSANQLPAQPREIKPHPYGVELGQLVALLQDTRATTLAQFLASSFSRVSPAAAARICAAARLGPRTAPKRIGRAEVHALHRALQSTRISAPATDCISPIGEELLLRSLQHLVPADFYAAVTRAPAVYRGNPFQIEVALAYGGAAPTERISLDALAGMLAQSDSRSLRQFLLAGFAGLGADAADRILAEARLERRRSPARLDREAIARLQAAMQSMPAHEGRQMHLLRYANRVPLQLQQAGCAITQAVLGIHWRAYGLSASKGALPTGPITLLVHVASVWVPFTSESKEAIASYPEIEHELRLALQAVGRKLARHLRRDRRAHQESERRHTFERYLGEVARAVAAINGSDEGALYARLCELARNATPEADAMPDERGRSVDPHRDPGKPAEQGGCGCAASGRVREEVRCE